MRTTRRRPRARAHRSHERHRIPCRLATRSVPTAPLACIQDSRNHCHTIFPWYNGVHRHSGIGMMTPERVHYGTAEKVQAVRQSVLDQAYIAHPERFVHSAPKALKLPTQVWINKPKTSDEKTR